MKKLIALLIVASFITACSSSSSTSYSTKVDDANTVVVEGKNLSITNQEIYEYLMASYGADYILDEALKIVAKTVIVDQEAIDTAVQEIIDSYINVLGDEAAFNKYVVETLGYTDVDTYINDVMIPSARQNLLSEKYVNENYQTLVENYSFRKLKVITFDTESTAYEVNSAITNGEITFDEAFAQYNTKTSQTEASIGLVSTLSSTSSVDSAIINLLPQLSYIGHYSVPVTLSDNASWALIFVQETDFEAFKEEATTTMISSSAVRTVVEVHYLKEYNFDVYESIIKKQIQSLSGGYLAE